MNLLDLITPNVPPYAQLKGLWLVFDAALAPALELAQENTNVKVSPIDLSDGRKALCADVLSEIGERGAYAAAFAKLDRATFVNVEVIDAETIQSLFPVAVDS